MHLIKIYDPGCYICHQLEGVDELVAKVEGWDLQSYNFEQIKSSNHPFLSEIREWLMKYCVHEDKQSVDMPTYLIANGDWKLEASSTVENIEKLKDFIKFYKAEALVYMPGLYDTELICITAPECEWCPGVARIVARKAESLGWGFQEMTTEQLHNIGGRLLQHVRMFQVDRLGKVKLPITMIVHVQSEYVHATGHILDEEGLDYLISDYKRAQSLEFKSYEPGEEPSTP